MQLAPFKRRSRVEPELAELVSITAAASRVTKDDARRERNSYLYGWQLQSLGYAESLGEIWYGSKFYERALRNLKLIVQRKNAEGVWELSEDPIPNEVKDALVDANGEQSALLGMYGRQLFLTGEARLLGTIDEHTGAEVWEMLSVQELHVNSEGLYIRQRGPGLEPETLRAAPPEAFRPTGDGAVMYRLWSPSPRWSDVADSPMRAVLDICEELLLLTRSVRGEIKSRLGGNGIMLLPTELMLPTLTQGVKPDEDPGADTFMDRLTKAMMTAIADEKSAASQIPILVRGPGEILKYVQHIRFEKPSNENEAKRTECVNRLAMSLDMPPEALKGIADTNHWGAWQIDESSWKVHIQPIAQTLVENLTASFFRPIMKDPNLRLWYDESEVVNHPDRSTDFKAGFDSYAVSAKAYRTAIGAKDDDAMSPEEQDRFAQLRALEHRGTGASATPPTDDATAAPAGPATTTPGAPATKPVTTPPAVAGAPAGPVAVPAAAKALVAAESAVWRCREVAGSRLRSKVPRAMFKDVANCDLAHAYHAADEHGEFMDHGTPDALVAGAGALFQRQLCGYGVPQLLAEQIVTAAEAHARDTLFDAEPGPLPDELIGLCTLGLLSGTPG